VRKLILTGRRAVGIAAATVVVGGVAATWLAGSALASPGPMLIATQTVVTGTAQQPNDSLGAVLKVNVQVTAKGGTTGPTGDVIVKAGPSNNCAASLTAVGGGSTESTGSCEVHNLSDQTYSVSANYSGSGNWSQSWTTSNTSATLTSSTPPVTTDVVSSLSCSRSVTIAKTGTCTLTVTNNGSSTASGITADISLPWQLSARSCGRSWGWGWLTGHTGGCTLNHNTATWKISSLAAGASKSEKLTFSASQGGYGSGFGHSHRWNSVTVKGSADTASQSPSNSKAKVTIYPRSGWFW
jgi:hypothetical protein